MKNFAAFRREMTNYSPEELMEADFGGIGGEERIYSGGRGWDEETNRGMRKMNRPKRRQKSSYLDEV